MKNSIALPAVLSTLFSPEPETTSVDRAFPATGNPEIDRLAADFLARPISPSSFYELECAIEAAQMKATREILARIANAAAAQVDALGDRAFHDGEEFRRLNAPTPNAHVASRFGTFTLNRQMFRCTRRDAGEPCISPAEIALGLSGGATPALAESATRYLAEAGSTQESVLQRLNEEHDVAMGPERLRKMTEERAARLSETETDRNVKRVLELLEKAHASKGKHKPGLSVGRDGVTIREYLNRGFEVAGVGTLAVFDRRGQRLGTVYIGCVPESLQLTLSQRLTKVITGVLQRWDKAVPHRSYVTDSGDNETAYDENVLRPMVHPRTGEALTWRRVVDFYHVMERVWAMAKALFGKDERGRAAWARRMGKLLKKPNGAFRVLHSAAALAARLGLPKTRQADFNKAYAYIRARTPWMKYSEYKAVGIPLGSGITEAACKTLVAQRLKLSGMRWKKGGSLQAILDLRATLISGTWKAANETLLKGITLPKMRTHPKQSHQPAKIAA